MVNHLLFQNGIDLNAVLLQFFLDHVDIVFNGLGVPFSCYIDGVIVSC